MRQTFYEFILALTLCWIGFSLLAGCVVDQRDVYNAITKTKPKVTRAIASTKSAVAGCERE